MSNEWIECAGWIDNSCGDGPGIRSVLFLQGCTRNCPGCQNSGIKQHGNGKRIAIQDIVRLIDEKCFNRKWIYRCAESACPVFWKSPVRKEEIAVPDR